ncbi:MAG TPA: mevalonate kinase, partial [Chloroflexaceae bacterium]|nr:mevalonate kinase [Chloroflexaceae bacterium]
AVGDLATRARFALAAGEAAVLGHLLDANQALLERMGVSSPELGRLVTAAREAGALGAKLSGAGWGGVMLALVTDETRVAVEEALREAGAARVLATTVSSR